MKIGLPAVLVIAIGSALAGAGFANVRTSIQRTQQVSFAGQTLADLARAIESERAKTGAYPDSITGLAVEAGGGDFSQELLSRVVYYRTERGYVAFVGMPHLAYVQPDLNVLFQ